MPERLPAIQFSTLAQQRETAELGIWVFLATEVLFFGGLILAYAVYRKINPDGFAQAARHTSILIGTINTGILLTSSFLVAWAVAVIRFGLFRIAARLMWISAALGLIFLVLKAVEYRMEYAEHLVPGLNFEIAGPNSNAISLFFAFYFVATGLHAIHLIIGIVMLIVIGERARRGAYSRDYNSPIIVAALYWHFVDLVWIFLFALIYLPGRAS